MFAGAESMFAVAAFQINDSFARFLPTFGAKLQLKIIYKRIIGRFNY
jgi:hypothetical protein